MGKNITMDPVMYYINNQFYYLLPLDSLCFLHNISKLLYSVLPPLDHAITTDAWLNNLDHYQGFVIIVALDLKIEELVLIGIRVGSHDRLFSGQNRAKRYRKNDE